MRKLFSILLLCSLFANAQVQITNYGSHKTYKWPKTTTGTDLTTYMGNLFSFQTGDSVLFQTGGKYTLPSEWIILANNLYIGSYTGASNTDTTRPVLTTVTTLPNSNLTNRWRQEVVHGSYNLTGRNVWRYLGDSLDGFSFDGNLIYRYFFDSKEYRRAHAIDSVNTRNRTYYNNGITGDNHLYVWATLNPATFYTNITFPSKAENTISFVGSSNITFAGLDVQGGEKNCMYGGRALNVTIQNCKIGAYTGHNGLTFKFGVKGATVRNNEFDPKSRIKQYFQVNVSNVGSSVEEGFAIYTGVHNANIYSNIFYNWGHAGIDVDNLDYILSGGRATVAYPSDMLVTEDGLNYSMSNVNIYDNISEADSIDYGRAILANGLDSLCAGPMYMKNVKIYRTLCRAQAIRSQIGAKGLVFAYNFIVNATHTAYAVGPTYADDGYKAALGISGYNNTTPQNMVIVGNVFANASGPGLYINQSSSTRDPYYNPVQGNLIANNIFYKNGSSPTTFNSGVQLAIEGFDCDAVMQNNRFENNILYSLTPANAFYDNRIGATFVTPTTTSNCTPGPTSGFYKSVSGFNARNGVSVNGQTADVMLNNLASDPQFTNPDAYDFTLAPSSPAIGAGKNLSDFSLPDALAAGSAWPSAVIPAAQGSLYTIGVFVADEGTPPPPPIATTIITNTGFSIPKGRKLKIQ